MVDYQAFYEQLKSSGAPFAFDTETTGLNWSDKLVSVSIANDIVAGNIWYNQDTHEILKKIFSLPNQKYCHNSLFDLTVLRRHGIITNCDLDTKIAYYCCYSQLENYHLKFLGKKFLNKEMKSFKELTHRKKDITYVDKSEAEKYAIDDAIATYQLANKILFLAKEKFLVRLEHAIIPATLEMQNNGVKIDVTRCEQLLAEYTKYSDLLYTRIVDELGEINIRSTQQLGAVLVKRFSNYKFKTTSKAKQIMCDSLSIRKLYGITKDPVLANLLEYRKLYKVISTYLKPMLEQKDNDYRIHTSFHSTGTISGRYSSSNPNLQNIPSKEDRHGKELRNLFIPSDGYKFIDVDYGQIELRVLAHASKDYNMIKVFNAGQDIHDGTAKLCGVDRITAKTLNFATIYGKHPRSLAEDFNLSVEQTNELIGKFYKQFPKIKELKDNTLLFLMMKRYVSSAFGRRRYFENFNRHKPDKDLRAAFNHLIQGTAADILKIFIQKIWDAKLPIRFILTVHDEVLFECRKELATEIGKKIKQIAETSVQMSVPLVADVKVIERWGEK